MYRTIHFGYGIGGLEMHQLCTIHYGYGIGGLEIHKKWCQIEGGSWDL